MKRILLAVILLICIAGGLVFYRFYWDRNVVHPSQFLPEDVLVYLNQQDLGEILAEMRTTPLADAVASINFVRLALDVDLSLQTVYKVREIQEFIESEEAALLFDEFLSTNFTVALLAQEGTDFKQFLHDNLIMFSEPRHSTALLELTGSLLPRELEFTSSQYGQYLIYRIPLDMETRISLVSAGGLLLAAFEERTLRRALDRFDENLPSLNEEHYFKNLSKKHRESSLFCFFSIDNLRLHLDNLLNPQSFSQNLLLSHLDDWRGFTSGAYGASRKENYSRDIITLHFNPAEINSDAAHFLGIRPEKNVAISQAPQQTLLYYWTNTFDLSAMWRMYVNESGLDPAIISQIEEGIASLTNISFEEILGLFGNSAHLLVGEPSPVDFVPIPNFTLIFSLLERAKTASTLQGFITKNLIPHKNASYRGVPMTFWGEGRQKGLQPVYALYGDALYISSSIQRQMDIVDTIMDGGSIVESPSFKRYGESLLSPNNSTAYIQVSRLLASIRELVKWSGTMIALQNRRAAYISNKLIEDLILPMIDGLQIYATIITRSYIENGKITIESNIIRTQSE